MTLDRTAFFINNQWAYVAALATYQIGMKLIM